MSVKLVLRLCVVEDVSSRLITFHSKRRFHAHSISSRIRLTVKLPTVHVRLIVT